MSRPLPYDTALEDALIDFKRWDRGEITAEDALALVPAIRRRLPDLERIVLTNRARRALDTTGTGIDSDTFARMFREAQRRTH